MSIYALDNVELFAIKKLINKIAQKDKNTAYHSLYVANIVKQYADQLNLETSEIFFLYYTALVHDVGKIFIPKKVLFKPGHLNKLEYLFVSFHSFLGYITIRAYLPKQKYMAYLVRNHHKKKNNDLYNNILVAADIYCALSETRCYKKALDYSEIEKIFKEENIVPEIREDFLSLVKG